MTETPYKARLLARLEELGGRLHDIEDSLEAPHSKDWDEMAVEREGDEVLERLGSSGKAEILRINAALKRIDDGEFGICIRCGSEVSKDRLDIVPETPLCRDCATKV